MYSAMDDVTSKIAYAYAKQQAFVALALALLVGGGAAALAGRSNVAVLGAALVDAAGAVVLLYVVYTNSNLAAITRPGLRLIGLLFLVNLLAWVAQAFLGGVPAAGGALLLALVFLLAAGVVAYPLPVRRGSAVLYAPTAVRDLANARSGATSAVALAAFGLARLVMPAATLAPSGFGVPGVVLAASLLAVGAAGGVELVAMPNSAARGRGLQGLLLVGTAVSLLGLLGRGGDLASWAEALAPALAAVLGVVVIRALSGGLNTGKTIVARRA